jgi:hypothetical protein
MVALAEPAGLWLPGGYAASPAVPFGSARWIYLLLGLSQRSHRPATGTSGSGDCGERITQQRAGRGKPRHRPAAAKAGGP